MAGDLKMYLRVTGNYQGQFTGKETIARSRGSNWFEFFSVTNKPKGRPPSYPVDPKYQDGSIVIVKSFDTFAFVKAQNSGEPLSRVEIDFTRLNADGSDQNESQLRLSLAFITDDSKTWDGKSGTTMETITIAYGKIESLVFFAQDRDPVAPEDFDGALREYLEELEWEQKMRLARAGF